MKQAACVFLPAGLVIGGVGVWMLFAASSSGWDRLLGIEMACFGLALIQGVTGDDSVRDMPGYLPRGSQFVVPPSSHASAEEWNEYARRKARALEHNYHLMYQEKWLNELVNECRSSDGPLMLEALSPEMRVEVERRLHG